MDTFIWNAAENDGTIDKFKYLPHSDWWAISTREYVKVYV